MLVHFASHSVLLRGLNSVPHLWGLFFGLVLQRRLCSRHTLQFLSSICVHGPKTLHLEDCRVSAIPLLVKQMCFLLQ